MTEVLGLRAVGIQVASSGYVADDVGHHEPLPPAYTSKPSFLRPGQVVVGSVNADMSQHVVTP